MEGFIYLLFLPFYKDLLPIFCTFVFFRCVIFRCMLSRPWSRCILLRFLYAPSWPSALQHRSDAFIFLSLSILNLFTQLLFTSVYFSNSLKHNDIHRKVWRQPRCYFPWFEYQKWESNNKKKFGRQSFSWLRTASPIDFYHFSLY